VNCDVPALDMARELTVTDADRPGTPSDEKSMSGLMMSACDQCCVGVQVRLRLWPGLNGAS
jgi:hypothetical protein